MMINKLILNTGILIATTLCLSGSTVAQEQAPEVSTRGHVLDLDNHPIPNARLILQDSSTGEVLTTHSKGDGSFKFLHPPSSPDRMLLVIPPQKSGFAQARMNNISGMDTRNYIIKLKRGFTISGRVVANGKGIRGLIVSATPLAKQTELKEKIHGGGHVVTGRNGNFVLTLTPGAKLLRISNEKYAGIPSEHKTEITVTGDSVLPDVVLPPVREASLP